MRTALYLSTFLVGLAAASMALAADGVIGVSAKGGTIDFVRAKPMPMPTASRGGVGVAKAAAATPATLGPSGVVPGSAGTGRMTPVNLPAPQPQAQANAPTGTGSRTPQQYGTLHHPFTTSRADGTLSNTTSFTVTSAYPWRATGKLFFNIGADTFVCSASLIKKGVVVTAAHCVIDYGAGSGAFFTGFQFIPGLRDIGDHVSFKAPFGTWTAQAVYARPAYVNGTDICAVTGIVCQNDIAVIVLKAKSGTYPGTTTGWYGYGYGGYSYYGGTAQITQLGYPVALDSGIVMERTDSYGYVDSTSSNNTVIGSRQTGGSSGGPWLVNFGIQPVQTPGYTEGSLGTAANPNVVVGVTSWGYTSGAEKEQGASPFLSTNIRSLVNTACANYPAACAN